MTLIDWLKLNPNHRCSLQADGDQVRAILKNGAGIDEHLVGVGDDEGAAIKRALHNRALLVAQLTIAGS